MKQLSQSIKLEIVDQIALIISDNPPVNALSSHVRDGIMKGLSEAEASDDIKAIMLYCEGKTFFAGADIKEFGKPLDPQIPTVRELISALESSSKPVTAAIHGTALGGGLETALGCHFRVATGEAKFGLPEVNLGIIPGAGGTLRLPRLTGVETGLKMMTSGIPISAQEALRHGLLDEIMEGDLREQALDFVRQLIAKNAPLISIRDRDDKMEEARKKPDLFTEFRKSIARKSRGFKAPEAIIKSVEASLNKDFEDALVYERELFVACQNSPQARAQQYFFFAERQAGKISDIPRETTVRAINSVAIIGSGTMGSGIAINFVNAQIPVILLDMSQEALERGLEVIRQGVTKTARRSGLDELAVQARLALITGSQQIKELNEVDLVIEAVFEDMKIKKSIFQDLDRICKPGAILATNTSYLDVNEIAGVTSRPQDVVGTHFFSPANIMKLLEIVRAEKTADDVIATCQALGKRIGKVSVVVGVCYGFVGNRLLAARKDQSNDMMLKNLMPQEVDQVIYDFGFPM
ncbi:MAG: 3-hydroxyacyl-CoA dehydrogenase, partial [Proteobacteria bacterium]|nr:3-hydroxyacyl-CoA dehydrogenase [Pseudomonadota bacterium]